MTSGRYREVDHDLLADYLGGALDGTPERDDVARLIDEEPAWAQAYARLAPALDLVRADLADWAAGPAPELPLAVADRITAALAGAGPAPDQRAEVPLPREGRSSTPTDLPTYPEVADAPADLDLPDPARQRRAGGGTPAGGTGFGPGGRRTDGVTRPADGPARGDGPGRRRRRWVRLAGPVALAAASITAVGLGVNHLVGGTGAGSDATVADRAAGSAAAPGALAAGVFRTTAPPRSSGTDYTPQRLAGRTGPALAPDDTSSVKAQEAPEGQRLPIVGDLGRLTGRAALDSCLAAVAAEHAGGAVTVDLVDYASFEGRPALVVTFVDAAGARWAWVSGPECGVPGSGADTRFRTRVG